jgi:hypothetical protein
MTQAEYIATYFEHPARRSLFAGIGPADVHNRAPRELPLVNEGAQVVGNGIMARANDSNAVLMQLPPQRLTGSGGVVPAFRVDAEDAVDGRHSALLTLGAASEAGMTLGQKVKAGDVGKTYTFSASVKPLGEPTTLHLEITQPSGSGGRIMSGKDTSLPPDRWTELSATFQVEKASSEGWFAAIGGGGDGDRIRVDRFQILEGERRTGRGNDVAHPGANEVLEIPFSNSSFEAGPGGWTFTCSEQFNVRRTYRRASFTMARLLANMGVAAETPLLRRFASPTTHDGAERRWLEAYYVDQPEEWDDPYRFFNW